MPIKRDNGQPKAKSVTLYLSDETVAKIDFFADATVRSKSQAAEFLVRMGLEQFVETSQTEPKDAPQLTRKPARRGRKPSVASAKVVEEKQVERKAPAPKPVAKKPAARKPAAKKAPAARKPRAKRAAA